MHPWFAGQRGGATRSAVNNRPFSYASGPLLLGALLLVAAIPSCLMIDLGVWGLGFGYDDDEPAKVPATILACCREQQDAGVDREACIDDALDGQGPCANLASDAGAAQDARVTVVPRGASLH